MRELRDHLSELTELPDLRALRVPGAHLEDFDGLQSKGLKDLDVLDDLQTPENTGGLGGSEASETASRTRASFTSRTDAPPTAVVSRRPRARRRVADPVKALMHSHRALCERAVDPLEIAAGLEAHGLTDRTVARFRHRDVFSLAEEMYARVPHGEAPRSEEPTTVDAPGAHAGWIALSLLPGALCGAAVAGVRLTEGQPRLVAAAVGALAVLLGLRAALRRGPLCSKGGTTSGTGRWTCWLLAYAALGDGLLSAGLGGGPHGSWPVATAPVLALALACAPASWCAHLFAVRARHRLAASRTLKEFADSVRPVLLAAFALFLCALAALLALCGTVLGESATYAGTGTLGALLLLARLLTVHGRTRVPALLLGAAAAAEAIALATVFASRLPGCSFLAVPVETVVGAWGPGALPGLVCGLAALTLLIHSLRTLTRASAHAAPPGPP